MRGDVSQVIEVVVTPETVQGKSSIKTVTADGLTEGHSPVKVTTVPPVTDPHLGERLVRIGVRPVL